MIQINGKVRGHITVPPGYPKDEVEKEARSLPAFAEWTTGKTVRKVIVVPDKLINFVVG